MVRVPVLESASELARLKEISVEWRTQLGLDAEARFDGELAAGLAGYEIRPLSSSDLPDRVREALGRERPHDFRAAASRPGSGVRELYVNDSHLEECQRFCAAHELSHLFLGHTPEPFTAVDPATGHVLHPEESPQELEANTLAHMVTIPIIGTNSAELTATNIPVVASAFGVFEARVTQALEMDEALRVANAV